MALIEKVTKFVKEQWLKPESTLLEAGKKVEGQPFRRDNRYIIVGKDRWIIYCLFMLFVKPSDRSEAHAVPVHCTIERSEERRVGNECRYGRWSKQQRKGHRQQRRVQHVAR